MIGNLILASDTVYNPGDVLISGFLQILRKRVDPQPLRVVRSATLKEYIGFHKANGIILTSDERASLSQHPFFYEVASD